VNKHHIVTQFVSCILEIFLWTRASKWNFFLKLRTYLILHLQKIQIYSHFYFAASFVLHSRLSEVPTQRSLASYFNIRLSSYKHIYVHTSQAFGLIFRIHYLSCKCCTWWPIHLSWFDDSNNIWGRRSLRIVESSSVSHKKPNNAHIYFYHCATATCCSPKRAILNTTDAYQLRVGGPAGAETCRIGIVNGEVLTKNVCICRLFMWLVILLHEYEQDMGRDSSVDIASRYGLEGPGIESRWGRDFPHQSSQPSTQWVPGLTRGKEVGA